MVRKINILSFAILLTISLNTYSQTKIEIVEEGASKTIVKKQIVVQQGSAIQTVAKTVSDERSETVSKDELEKIKLDVSDLLLRNHFDKNAVITVVEKFHDWIESYKKQDNILVVDFTKALTSWLREETDDKHYIFQEVGRRNAGGVEIPGGWYMDKYNYGLSKLEWFPDGIAYMEYKGFNPLQIPDAKRAIDNAMSFLKNAHTVIIDLRENRGGGGDMAAYLLSFFLKQDSTPLWRWEYRYNEEDFSSLDYSFRIPDESKMTDKKLYVLVSSRTASASELFLFGCQSNGIGLLVGENSSGGTHSMATFPVAERFTFGLPHGRKLDPTSGIDTQTKGGIVPDVTCSETVALEKALDLIRKKENTP